MFVLMYTESEGRSCGSVEDSSGRNEAPMAVRPMRNAFKIIEDSDSRGRQRLYGEDAGPHDL